ncbi:MAG: hypothetical protein EA392_08945 [Cryomorphaceae bacterium]|nr:MAG: hypothetical protein EA392_08945 [Cryomorphaceae bacterium]
MCTLTFAPLGTKQVITINRDEAPERRADDPVIRERSGKQLWLAPEPVSGSSNVVFDIINHRLVVLLNGAFESHEHKPPYRLSRGLVILDSFDYDSLGAMKRLYDFTGIEPFTLLAFQKGATEEMRWDGEKVHYTDPAAHQFTIWSSAKLYPAEVIQSREEAFADWLKKNQRIYAQQLFDMHQREGDDSRGPGFRMNYEDLVKTVSITQFTLSGNRVALRYLDLMRRPAQLMERVF